MAYKVEFAGRELHEYVTILNVNRKFPERMNFTKASETYGNRRISKS